MFDVRTYQPGGPTLKRFHESSAFFRPIAGPIGSGKTTAAGVAEMFFTPMIQPPGPDGVRRAKVGVLRDTYRNLYATFIPSWFKWVPREYGRFVGSDDRPALHEFAFDAPYLDGSGGMGRCEAIVEMRALGPNTVEAVCRGWELTGADIDEMDLVPKEALSFLAGRVMRYGDKATRRTRGVWGTFNKPDIDHWLYEVCVEDPMEGLEFFDQPSGLLPGQPYRTNPAAENLENLDDGYYETAAKGQPEWYIRRMLRNQWGASVAGELIYPEFSDDTSLGNMLPEEIEPEPGTDLILGLDGGRTPAGAVVGRDGWGRRICYAEAVMADPFDPKGRRLLRGVGPRRFAEYLGDVLFPRFRRCRIPHAYADPAMFYGADKETGEYSDVETISQILKIPILPAPSNEVSVRHEAVRLPMTSVARDGRRCLLLNPSCKWLRRGFVSDYKWEVIDPKQPLKRLNAQKSNTSHVHDALQYVLLGDIGRAGVTGGAVYDRHQPKNQQRYLDEHGWQPEAVRLAQSGQRSGDTYGSDFDLWKV